MSSVPERPERDERLGAMNDVYDLLASAGRRRRLERERQAAEAEAERAAEDVPARIRRDADLDEGDR